MPPTSLEHERAKQKRWQLRPASAHLRGFDELVDNEFLSPAEQAARQCDLLQSITAFAAREVPYYTQLFQRLGLAPTDIRTPADLARLPILTRRLIQDLGPALHARNLPPHERVVGLTRTSGTTGQPVVVVQSQRSQLMFTLLKQRARRWDNVDPLWLAASISDATGLPRLPDGSLVRGDTTCHRDSWMHLGKFFHTGPFVGLDDACSVDRQIAWLDEHRPQYLHSLSANLEHIALAFQARPRPDYLRSLTAVSQQMTPAMRRRIESILQVPVYQGYGFNEIGIVATECPEARRFHVHAEHSLVEIINADGSPTPPGQFGRILVTGLTNTAMPLLRYDPDDLAMPVAGPCPCGRTLPSFAAIQGRYRRMAFLPPGVWNHWSAIQRAGGDMPLELLQPLRQYQAHHHRDGRFLLRLAVTAPLAPAFYDRLRAEWALADREIPLPLEIVELPAIPPPPGKFLDFTSDFVPPPDWEPPPTPLAQTLALDPTPQ